MVDTTKLTSERHQTHGSFERVAHVSYIIQRALSHAPSWDRVSIPQKIALQEIAHKMARIVCGNPLLAEHWHDIQGYGDLGERACVEGDVAWDDPAAQGEAAATQDDLEREIQELAAAGLPMFQERT